MSWFIHEIHSKVTNRPTNSGWQWPDQFRVYYYFLFVVVECIFMNEQEIWSMYLVHWRGLSGSCRIICLIPEMSQEKFPLAARQLLSAKSFRNETAWGMLIYSSPSPFRLLVVYADWFSQLKNSSLSIRFQCNFNVAIKVSPGDLSTFTLRKKCSFATTWLRERTDPRCEVYHNQISPFLNIRQNYCCANPSDHLPVVVYLILNRQGHKSNLKRDKS